jgi:hypothetical protein
VNVTRGQYNRLLATRTSGAALVIVLAFVVLLTGVVVAYFSRTTVDRQLASASFANTAADLLARSALDVVLGDLRQEIANDGTPPSSAARVVPERSGNPADVPNLVKRSVNPDTHSISSRASAVNSAADPSANGRTVSAARWNRHYLIPRRAPVAPQTGASIYSDPILSFVPPDWVLVTDAGPTVLTAPSASVIGRYAYAVYDEGGLLDMNVAGFPSANSSNAAYVRTIGRKGALAFADLTATGLSFGAIDNMIGWRNYLSAAPVGRYKNFSFPTNPTTFTTHFLDQTRDFGVVAAPSPYPTSGAAQTDQSFTNRTQLLEVRRTLSADQDAMQSLGTMARGRNRPTWGTSATVLAGRFPLARFDLFATTPPNPAAAAAIQQHFGLAYVPATGTTAEHWRYYGTTGTTLQQEITSVAGTNQDPDLFSLLQYAFGGSATTEELLSIGASLIDQRDENANAETTWIEFADVTGAPLKAFGLDVNPSNEPGAPPRPASPTFLNRPFRNVGELGYAYRNAATTLNFRAAGPDSVLLDLFTFNTAASRPGQLNLNTRNVGALAAAIKGAFPLESSSSGITDPAAKTAAESIIVATSLQPAMGRDHIARLAGAVTNPPFSADEQQNEAVTRALSELTQTRTWNLMIDVVAQSGRYPPNVTAAADLPKFVVRSEKRYWLHVAIDRFTGEVLEQQLEAIYE